MVASNLPAFTCSEMLFEGNVLDNAFYLRLSSRPFLDLNQDPLLLLPSVQTEEREVIQHTQPNDRNFEKDFFMKFFLRRNFQLL